MRKLVLGLLLSVFAYLTYAQMPPTEIDALRFSQSSGLYGSAASVGKAGAIGALGGDFSSAVSNPAGLGLFYRSEVSYSPMWQWRNTESEYEGMSNFRSNSSGRFGTFSSVFSFKLNNNDSKLRAIQIGFGNNRTNQYNNTIGIKGKAYTSAADEWLYLADNYGYEDYRVDLANLAGLLFFDTVNNVFWTPIDQGELTQTKIVKEKGGAWDYNISFSANYDDFIYLGATIGLPDFSYRRMSTYSEDDELNIMPDFDYFDYHETNEVDGNGVNLKLGVIVRALDWLRLGAAYHTPTYYRVESRYWTEIESSVFGESRPYYVDSRDYYSSLTKYSLRTPSKFLGSLAFVIGDQGSKLAGSFSADYEYMNYASMRFSSDMLSSENDIIKETYKGAHNLRLGGQLNAGEGALRLGYAYFSSPYKDKKLSSDQHAITAGLGYKSKWYYIDFAYAYSFYKDKHLVYDTAFMEMADMNYKKNTFILTFGFRF